jgi:hypothetical protein
MHNLLLIMGIFHENNITRPPPSRCISCSTYILDRSGSGLDGTPSDPSRMTPLSCMRLTSRIHRGLRVMPCLRFPNLSPTPLKSPQPNPPHPQPGLISPWTESPTSHPLALPLFGLINHGWTPTSPLTPPPKKTLNCCALPVTRVP